MTMESASRSGPASIPARSWSEYDLAEILATGEPVTVAARLEQTAAPGEILIGEPTYRLVRDAVQADDAGPARAQGQVSARRERGGSSGDPGGARRGPAARLSDRRTTTRNCRASPGAGQGHRRGAHVKP